MHRMTRDARGAEVRAPFDGRTWRFKDDRLELERHDGDRFVRIEPAVGAARTYRITRIIGGRTREDFVGLEVGGGSDAPELVMPVSFVFATGALRYKGYSVMLHERPSLRAGPVWSRTCIFCHNTVPEMDRLLESIAPERGRAYQGESVDRWLPPERRARSRVVDEAGFRRAVAVEVERLGGAPAETADGTTETAARGIDAIRAKFDGAALVEEGIGCEACHGGGRAHAAHPDEHPSFVPRAPWLDVALPAGKAQAANRVCARCHQVLFSGYPFTWEGARRGPGAGGSHISSGEARDFLLGGCSGEMACTTCHDPHGGADGEADKRRWLASPAGNVVCTTCHRELADRERLRAHAHHDPGGAAGSCVACHMPRKNMGLDGTLTRYHRISSPTDPARVLGDRPLECALCHADQTVGALADAMERWWPVRFPRSRLEELYGGLGANVMRATLERGKPHERVVAMATLGEAHAADAAPAVARELLDAYPLVREWAKAALGSMRGACEVDLAADDAAIAKQAAVCAGGRIEVPEAVPREHDEDPED
ncbi:MAG TPA: cytochrome c3 family protein [Polyangiaceae bacterium]|jgi:predicted CXXCH cytochrome family protein